MNATNASAMTTPATAAGLRVCLYYPWLYLTSGGERTIIEIAKRSRHRVTIVTNEYQPDATFPELRELDVRVLNRVPVKRSLGAVGVAAWTILRQKIDLSEFDALLVVCEGLGDLVALRHPNTPAFCLCLTPLRIVFDPVYRATYLNGRGLGYRLAVRVGGAAFAALDRLAWRRYRRVFPISREIEQRILKGRLTTPEKMQIMHPGIDLDRYVPAASASASSSASEKTFFVPGRIMWTKNLELAINAFKLFQQRIGEPGWKLKIAGIVDRKSEAYLARLRELAGDAPGIEFCLHPDDQTMRAMYASCYATLFTAFNEDWGLVIIEAMATGKPAIALNRGGPREIVRHDDDGLLVEGTPEAFADAMMRMAREPGLHERLSARARPAAERFGWPSFVQALDEAIARGVTAAASPALGNLSEVRG